MRRARRRAGPSRAPLFVDPATAVASAVTCTALVGLVVSDLAARPRAGDRVGDRGTGTLVAAGIAVAVATTAASLAGPRRRPLPRRPFAFRSGLALAWAGIALNRWGRGALAGAYRPVVTVVADHEVVERGPYRLVRHPMYAGSTLVCLGIGVALGTAPVVAAWALPPLALLRRIVVEEAVLAEALGERWDAFAAPRARLVPGVW